MKNRKKREKIRETERERNIMEVGVSAIKREREKE